MGALQADEMFACLDRHSVRYVLIGGLAAVLHGSPLPTLTMDISPSPERPNLERLAAALREMEARPRTPDAPEGGRFPCSSDFLGNGQLLNLATRFAGLALPLRP